MNKFLIKKYYFLPLISTITLAMLMFTGCNAPDANSLKGVSSSTTGTSTSSSTNTSVSSSCTSVVVDSGQKGTATSRGSFSDTRIIPSTTYPATAYLDTTAAAIKLSYWYVDPVTSVGRFITETVAGDATAASFIRLAFLTVGSNSGVPMVFWTNNTTTVRMAMRSAAISTTSITTGTWNTANIDTLATAARALEVAVSPIDQVGVFYLRDTAASANAGRFIYCEAGCSSPSSFVAMGTPGASATVDSGGGNCAAATAAVGISWCKTAASMYVPAVTYGGATNIRYAVCAGASASSLANCASSTGWNTASNGAAVAGVVSTKLYLNPNTTLDTPKIIAKTAAGTLVAYTYTSACNTTLAGAANSANISGTAIASTWLSFLKDANDRYHIVANDGTTNVRYYNSNTSNIATGGWDTFGNIDTVTLPAINVGAGGADISTSTSKIYTSYGPTSAPANIMMATVQDITSSSTATFSSYGVNNTGHMQLLTAQTRNISVAATSGGVPAVAYVDFSIGAAAAAKLKYALRGGTSASSTWTSYIIPSTGTPQFPSLAFDHNNKPWIAYYEAVTFRWYLATNNNSDGSGTWTSYQFPLVTPTASYTLPATNDTALAMQYVSGVAYPVMFVINSSTAGGTNGIFAAKFTPSSATWSTRRQVDTGSLIVTTLWGSTLSVDYETGSSSIAVAYRDNTTGRVMYNYTTDPTAAWSTPMSVSLPSMGQGISIKINPSTTKPAITYHDRANGKVYYSPCSGTLSTCRSTGGWTATSLEAGTTGATGLTAAATDQLLYTGLAFTNGGTAYVHYSNGVLGSGGLTQSTNATGSFVNTTFDAGSNGNILGGTTVNFAIAGWNVQSMITSLNTLVTAYIGAGNNLTVRTCGD